MVVCSLLRRGSLLLLTDQLDPRHYPLVPQDTRDISLQFLLEFILIGLFELESNRLYILLALHRKIWVFSKPHRANIEVALRLRPRSNGLVLQLESILKAARRALPALPLRVPADLVVAQVGLVAVLRGEHERVGLVLLLILRGVSIGGEQILRS